MGGVTTTLTPDAFETVSIFVSDIPSINPIGEIIQTCGLRKIFVDKKFFSGAILTRCRSPKRG
jgi:hypothetical protein